MEKILKFYRSYMESSRLMNPFTSMLHYMHIEYTYEYANQLYNEHPHKYNMYGLSMMLSNYKIENEGIRLEDKTEIAQLYFPFIAHFGNEFVIVYKISDGRVYYMWRDKKIKSSIESFNKIWSGVVLLAEKTPETIEPNYHFNLLKECYQYGQHILCLLLITAFSVLCYLKNGIYADWKTTCLIILSFPGIYVGYLLLLKQMHIQSKYADKVCTLLKKGDCNNILESSAAKFMGLISWSEVGLSYFISNLLVLLTVPSLIPYYSLINICTLPYSLWSIWYQKYRAKQWCPLCLCVQILLWIVFIGNLCFRKIEVPDITVQNICLVAIFYILPFLLLDMFIPKFNEAKKSVHIKQEMSSIKMKDEVFLALLKKSTHYEVNKSTSKILLGNKDSDTLITILTNPHCVPCAKMHRRINQLLHETEDKICIQYIFSAFNEELEISNKFLIAAYLNRPIEEVKKIYMNWYATKKYDKENFFKQFNFDLNASNVKEEFDKHHMWKEKCKLNATPTILYNGYELPDIYHIEDIKYFTNLIVDFK